MIQKLIESIKKILNKILFPKWLQKRDRYFLLYRPRLWVLKLHYVFYYVVLANLLIICLVSIYPLKPYHISVLWQINSGVLFIVVIPALFYWCLKQYLFNDIFDAVQKFGKVSKNFGLLEILGYSVGVILIASVVIIFNYSIAFKMTYIVVPQNKLNIDLLILNSIENINSQNNSKYRTTDINTYLEAFKYKPEKEATKNICNKEYNKLLATNDNIKNILKEKLSCQNVIFLDLKEGLVDSIEVFHKLIDNKNNKLITRNISTLANLIESIQKNDQETTKAIQSIINRYSGMSFPSSYSISFLINLSLDNADLIYDYYSDMLTVLFAIYLICNLVILLIFLFNNIYLTDCVSGILYIVAIGFSCLYIASFLSSYSLLRSLKQEIILSILFFAFALFITYHALSNKKANIYSQFKTLNLIALPFTAVMFTVTIVTILSYYNFIEKDSISVRKYYVIASLAYIPLIPYLKKQLINQLFLPID
ncbi:MAG: hypothetical protein RM368_36995 [Nostoc sp. DedSLP03]|uniref:hypothetical protein n=1 Tax=Nostoc sp. DedSLP03 TaxID=3075400 RepID=UPI002AD3563E|nr:hypothetical protein [Nostoc sp. DedSLP03]MDZ7970463.1 hypothetical protein [Nostoc sp. DedSLP03]